MMNCKFVTTLLFALIFSCCVQCTQNPPGMQPPEDMGDKIDITTQRVASGLSNPVYVTAPAGDSERLFVVEQGGGGIARIQIVMLSTNEVLSVPFLSISGVSTGGERGLLGLAFHPDFSQNGYFFVNYTNTNGNTVISRFTVSDDPNLADADSETIFLVVEQDFANHNGGCIQFGPDGMLYIGMGDGGSANDPNNNARNMSSLLGKMLRLDVNGASPFIPSDNPFINDSSTENAIWASGLRNPWRFSFDRMTGDMYIADVGQGQFEEISFQPANSQGGESYGWRCFEGTNCTGLNSCFCGVTTDVTPFHVYDRSVGFSITGGYVYRGTALTNWQGTYFFADFGTSFIASLEYNGSEATNIIDRTNQLAPGNGLNIQGISSFGEDAEGELYICDYFDGEIFKIVPSGT